MANSDTFVPTPEYLARKRRREEELGIPESPADAGSPEFFHRDLKRLLNDYSDEVPPQMVSSYSPPPEGYEGWKVRTGWFTQLLEDISLLEAFETDLDIKIPEEFKARYRDFALDMAESRKDNTPITRETIAEGNELIRDSLKILGFDPEAPYINNLPSAA